MTRKPDGSNRREFLKTASVAGFGLSLASSAPAFATRLMRSSPNETVRVAVVGVNGYGARLARTFAAAPNAEVGWICDVDEHVIGPVIKAVAELQEHTPQAVADFRRILDDPQLDALVIATPNHWHVPAAIMALKAGKHVYVEKPAGHNPHEGELLAEAQQKFKRLVQMGNQQRSHRDSVAIIGRIHEGLIGRVYQARSWYTANRQPIGRGKSAAVPPGLDYELWQGPAPRTPYRDNVIHYNWHWFKNWGNGEIGNNGSHEIDIARWALAEHFPSRVTFVGGKLHFDDDWEFADTQDVGFEFESGKSLIWQGRSANNLPPGGRARGVSVHGTQGSVVIDRNGYEVYALDGKKIEEQVTDASNDNTSLHVANFIAAIRTGEALNSPIADARKSVLLTQLGNIAHAHGGILQIDPATGHIRDNEPAMSDWARGYEPGWEPEV